MPGRRRAGERAFLAVAMAAAPAIAWAQPRPPSPAPPRFAVLTEIVEVEVVVTDGQGRFARDLEPRDFVLLEDGRPQRVTHFALRSVARPPATPAPEGPVVVVAPSVPVPVEIRPRRIVLAVDDLHLAPANLLKAKMALLRFLERQVADEDEVALCTTSGSAGTLEDFTRDRERLRYAIERLAVRDMRPPDSLEPPRMNLRQADMIERNDSRALEAAIADLMIDDPAFTRQMAEPVVRSRARELVSEAAHAARISLSTLQALVSALRTVSGRKALVLLSDGFYTGLSQHFDLREITATATRSGVVIYSIDARGADASPPLGDASRQGYARDPYGDIERFRREGFEADRDGLNTLARDTGGLPIFNQSDLNNGLGRVLEDAAASYVLAYEPASSPRDGRFHKIEVKLQGQRGLNVRTHKGYFAERSEAPVPTTATSAEPPDPAERRLAAGLGSPFTSTDLPLELASGFLETAEQGALALVSVRADLASAAFTTDGGENRLTLRLSGAFLDEKGLPVAQFRDRRDLRLDAAGLERARREGMRFTTRTPLRPGRYRVRAAVLAGENRLGTASRGVFLPDLAADGFTLSDLMTVNEDGTGVRPLPESVAVPRAGTLRLLLFAYGAKGDAEVHADVLFRTEVLAAGQVVLTEDPENVVIAADEPALPRLACERELRLAALAPGAYTLRITATDRIAKRSAERSLSLRVEP
jgi:VWFA-related protein